MDKIDVKENTNNEEQGEPSMGLSDIIDILNTLDNNSPTNCSETSVPPTANIFSTPSSCSSSPLMNPLSLNQSPVIVNTKKSEKPYIKIVEQPANKALRFRYECEGRSAGSIPGANSTAEIKTFPVIEIANYKGEVTIVVSCVTKDPPYRPHPHNLVGKEGCEHGVCTMRIKGDPPRAVFSNLGIQCVRRKDIKTALELRESKNVDPFKTKFAHKDQPSSIDLNVVRLCFQAFIQTGPRQYKKLQPVVTDPVYDRKAVSNLAINRLCSCSAKVSGGDEIIMLCEKVSKDIKIKFYELNNEGYEIWYDYAEFQHSDIHKGTAIAFKTPRYHNPAASHRVQVYIQLVRPSDGATSEPLPFEYYPDQGMPSKEQCKFHLEKLEPITINDSNCTLNSDIISVPTEDSYMTSSETTTITSELSVIQAKTQLFNENLNRNKDCCSDEKIDQCPDFDNRDEDEKSLWQTQDSLNGSFDETATYASFQLALKNPIVITNEKDVTSTSENLQISHSSVLNRRISLRDTLVQPLLTKLYSKSSISDLNIIKDDVLLRPTSQSIIRPTSDPSPFKRSTASTPSPRRKRNLFSRLFSRTINNQNNTSDKNNKTTSPTTINDKKPERRCSFKNFWSNNKFRNSVRSFKSSQPNFLEHQHTISSNKEVFIENNPSNETSTPNIIHIPLKVDDHNLKTSSHLAGIPLSCGHMELVAIADKENLISLCQGAYGIVLDPSVDLNESEHFALYASVPSDSNKNDIKEFLQKYELLTPEQVAKRFTFINKESNNLESK